MKLSLSRQNIPVIATLVVLVSLYVAAGMRFEGFFSLRVLVNFLATTHSSASSRSA